MHTTPDNEKALFARIAEGDETAFRELFHLYTPLLRPLIFKLTKSEYIIEDILQDVFFKVWMQRDKLTNIENPRSWILKIAFHDCFGHLRKMAVRNRGNEPMPEESMPEEDLEFRETARLVEEAIALLPPQAQRIYLLSRHEGLKLVEIAERTGLSLQTVKNTLSRALRGIREYLEKRGIYLPLLLLWYWIL